jgi:hypothetical protein
MRPTSDHAARQAAPALEVLWLRPSGFGVWQGRPERNDKAPGHVGPAVPRGCVPPGHEQAAHVRRPAGARRWPHRLFSSSKAFRASALSRSGCQGEGTAGRHASARVFNSCGSAGSCALRWRAVSAGHRPGCFLLGRSRERAAVRGPRPGNDAPALAQRSGRATAASRTRAGLSRAQRRRPPDREPCPVRRSRSRTRDRPGLTAIKGGWHGGHQR